MKKAIKICMAALLLMMAGTSAQALSIVKYWRLESPEKKTQVVVKTFNYSSLNWRVEHNGVTVLNR